jgi:hypothetical protein
MSATFALDTTEHQNSFLEILTTELTSMFGLLDVLLLN